MTKTEVMAQLKKLGNEQTRKTWLRHGAQGDIFGVKIGDMKPMVKKIKMDYELALDLFATGNGDAQYFAGLIADDKAMTKKDLQTWVETATWCMAGSYSVAWVAAGSNHGWELGLKWIESKKDNIAVSGWATLSSYLTITPDEKLDLPAIQKLLDRVVKTIHSQPAPKTVSSAGDIKYWMNNFVICVGGYVLPLHEKAVAAAKKIGKVEVDMGDTDCKVPLATEYIDKVKCRGTLGKKRKSAKC